MKKWAEEVDVQPSQSGSNLKDAYLGSYYLKTYIFGASTTTFP
jgi:hypothetical protein